MKNIESFQDFLFNWLLTIVLIPVIILLIINGGKFIPIFDFILLYIHEGGHGVFKIFGKTLYILGGTIMQLAIPVMFIIYYYVKKIKSGLQIFLVILGHSLMNSSVYISDARTMALPLFPPGASHDWYELFSKWEMLEYDTTIGTIVFTLGVISMLLALVVPFLLKKEEYKFIDIDLKQISDKGKFE